ncbi:MAG: RpoL/Rpb11 RNA polymerase subunit family protein [Nitrososphaeraceae archaeon]
MNAEISKLTNNEVELKFKDEDISLLYIIQHHLLNEKNVDFAGVIIKHPLIKDFLVKIITEDPMAKLEKSIVSAKEFAISFSDSIESVFKRENK